MPDWLQAASILLLGCLLLAAVEMIGQRAERYRRIRWIRESRRAR